MNAWEQFFGSGDHLTTLQMTIRAICMFFITLLLIRLSGMRTFGKASAFDVIITIMLGAILSRGITGGASFVGVVLAATVLVIIHRLIGLLSVKLPSLERIVKGEDRVLYKDGQIKWRNMIRSSVSLRDLEESIREEIHADGFEKVETIYIDSNGKISVIEKKK